MDTRMLIHPGEILRDEFMAPHGLNANRLALALDVPANRINDVMRGKRAVTAETAILLAHAFGTTPEFWLNLQARYELDQVRATGATLKKRIRKAEALARELAAA